MVHLTCNQRSPTIDLSGCGANEDPSSSKDLGRTLALFVEDKGDSDETTTTKTDMLDMCPF